MGFDNVNVNVSGPMQPSSTYKTKVLKGNHSFASQVTEPDTKYVIKYNFDLGGENVTIPANCVLEFEGGSISGAYTIIGNGCIIKGDANIRCDITGIGNGVTLLSWFTKESNKNTALLRALTCAGTSNDTEQAVLDGENIPIIITGQINLSETQRCDIINLIVNFTATEDGESLFLYNENTSWNGHIGNIKHCKFSVINPTEYKNVHCLHFRHWDNTTRTSIEDVQIIGFSGYMFICESYMQEMSFVRFKGANVGGFISFNKEYNTANAFGDYGAGSSNILSFYQCGIDGSLNAENTITDIIDLTKTIDVTFIDCVWQGDSIENKNGMNISAYGSLFSPEIIFINCWFEFANPLELSNNTIIIDDNVVFRCNRIPCSQFHFKGEHTVLYTSLNNMTDSEVQNLFNIDSGVYPKIVIDGTINQLNIATIIALYSKTSNLKINAGSYYGNDVDYSEASYYDLLPMLPKIQNSFSYYEIEELYENGIKFLRYKSTLGYGGINFDYYNNGFAKHFNENKAFVYRIVYRIVPVETVTSEDISNYNGVIDTSNYFESSVKNISAVYVGQSNNPSDAEWREALICPLDRNNSSVYIHYDKRVIIDIAVCEIFQGDISIQNNIFIDPTDNKKLIGNKNITQITGKTRPTLSAKDVGFMMFDTTLGKPIYWNGSAWVDATGATV